MPDYGKALSAYKKIDKIKSSALNIQRAKNMISEQRGKAIEENRKLTREKEILNSINAGLFNAGTAVLSESDAISGEDARLIGTAGSIVGNSLIEASYGSVTNNAGLGQQGSADQYERARIDVAGDALSTYNFLDSHYNEKKSSDIISSIKKIAKENPNISKEELLSYLDSDEVGFRSGEGYSVDERDIINALKERHSTLVSRGDVEASSQDDYVDKRLGDFEYKDDEDYYFVDDWIGDKSSDAADWINETIFGQ